MNRQRLVRIGSSLVSSLLLQARNLVISVVVFRLFTDPRELWGTVNQVVATVTLLALPAKFGLEFTAVQLVSKYRDEAPRAALEAFWQASGLRLVLTLVASAPMLFAPHLVAPWLGLGALPELVVVGGMLLVTSSLYEYAAFLLSGTDNFPAMMVGRLLYAVVNIAGIGWVAWGALGAGDDDLAGPILWAQVAAGGAALLWALWALTGEARTLAHRARTEGEAVVEATDAPAPSGRGMLWAITAFSVPMTLVSAAGQIFTYLDRVMIPVLSDRESLGSYAVASSVVGAALFGTYAFRNVARTKLPGQLRKDPAKARETLLATYRASMVVSVWIAAGTFAVAPDLLHVIYGADAAEAASMLQWFVPFVLLSAHANFSATALVAADRPRTYAYLMGALSVLNFGLNVLFIPMLQGFGAILASTLSLVPLTVIAYKLVADAYGGALWSWAEVRAAMPTTLRLTAFGALATVAGHLVSGPTPVAAVGGGLLVTGVLGALLAATGELHAVREAM